MVEAIAMMVDGMYVAVIHTCGELVGICVVQ